MSRHGLHHLLIVVEAERYASGAANGRSDVGAEAIGGRLQALVRQGPSLYLSLPPLVPHAY